MKLIWLMALLGLISCVSDKDSNSNKPGIHSGQQAIVTEEDAQRIKKICDALDVKLATITEHVNREMTFGYAEKTCEAQTLGALIDTNVILRSEGGYYVFRKGLDLFGFQDLETTQVGKMVEICRNVNALKNPIFVSSTTALYFTSLTKNSECSANGVDSACIKITTAVQQISGSYKDVSSDVMKFNLKDPYIGFFTERTQTSWTGCSGKNGKMKSAVLR